MTTLMTFKCDVCGTTVTSDNPQHAPGWVFVQIGRGVHHTCGRVCALKLLGQPER